MAYYLVKITVTTLLVVIISEISRRSTLIGAILASVPLVSVLAMLWLYVDTGSVVKVTQLARSVFWLVLPSLALFIVLPLLLKNGVNFYVSMAASIAVTITCYWILIRFLLLYGVEL